MERGQAHVAAILAVVLVIIIAVIVVLAFVLSQRGAHSVFPGYPNYGGSTAVPAYPEYPSVQGAGQPYGPGVPGVGQPTGYPPQGSTGQGSSGGVPAITGSNSWCVPGQTENTGISTAVVEGMTTFQGQSLCRGKVNIKGLDYYAYFSEDDSPGYITDSNGMIIYTPEDFATGERAPGCADGTREGFLGASRYPNIAACEGTWTNPNLRASGAGSAESLCASGWHICMKSGSASEISSQVTKWQCLAAGGGAFVAASSHCSSSSGCTYGALGCTESGWCSEPICCGMSCSLGACSDALWPGATYIARLTSDGCGNFRSSSASGVLCCKDASAPSGTPTGGAWCVPGGNYDYSAYGYPGYGGSVVGMATFRGQSLCKAQVYGEYAEQTFFVYFNQDGSVWYVTDAQNHVIQSSTGEYDPAWITQYG